MNIINKSTIIEALISGIVWSIAFIYIRKGMNKRNFIENAEKKRTSFFWDGVYGGLSVFVAIITKKIIRHYINF